MRNNPEKKMDVKGFILHDIQVAKDDRGLEIDQVGVCDFRYPIVVLDRYSERQHTMFNLRMSVNPAAPD